MNPRELKHLAFALTVQLFEAGAICERQKCTQRELDEAYYIYAARVEKVIRDAIQKSSTHPPAAETPDEPDAWR
jgi:hypothetical protein